MCWMPTAIEALVSRTGGEGWYKGKSPGGVQSHSEQEHPHSRGLPPHQRLRQPDLSDQGERQMGLTIEGSTRETVR